MSRYTYRIDRYFSTQEGWGPENDESHGTEDYDGSAEEFAQEILRNRADDLASERTSGRWRVLVWEGDEQGDNTVDEADGWAETVLTEQNFPNLGGRPKVGNTVSVAMGHTLPRVDAYAKFHGFSRAEAIRHLVTEGMKASPATIEIIASSGAEVMEDRATWGYIDEGGAFIDQVVYEEGDEIEGAVARFQREGKIPHGGFTVKRERANEYWVHEEHPWCYIVTIDPNEDSR